jgi:hypothetical protein
MTKAAATITNTLMNAPLPLLIEKLGLAIATAQEALDKNSIAMASSMATTLVTIDDKEYNLISLGFVPTFYAFTEATIEAKLEFSLTESEDFSIGGSVGVNVGVVAVSISASYARKFEMSASGSSSIATRLISLPPPERLKSLLNELSKLIPVTKITVTAANNVTTMVLATNPALQLNVAIEPTDATEQEVIWEIIRTTPNTAPAIPPSVSATGILTVTEVGTYKVKAKSKKYTSIVGEITIIVN